MTGEPLVTQTPPLEKPLTVFPLYLVTYVTTSTLISIPSTFTVAFTVAMLLSVTLGRAIEWDGVTTVHTEATQEQQKDGKQMMHVFGRELSVIWWNDLLCFLEKKKIFKLLWDMNQGSFSPRAEADLIAWNDQVSNTYFWKGTTMGQLKMGILNLASGGSGFFSTFLLEIWLVNFP